MSEEEKVELEEEKAKEEKRNVAKQLATSFPKFVLNGLIAIAIGLFYLFIVPLFQPVLDAYPILVIYTLVLPGVIILTGYSILAIGILLVILLFGIEAIMQFARSADAFAEFVISRLPGMRSSDSKHPRRIPLDLIYIFFILVVYVIISPIFLTGNFPIPLLEPSFQIIAVAFVLFFVLVFVYDLAKSIQKSAKRGIDRFGARLGRRYEDRDEPEKIETDY
ncbi:MAG: hypothetical protein Q6364_00555 [Candidatus Hermodarchaeota archaeon]|nr:hypothetical protein [Candidatus Hermodarchaeota archaeon]